VPRRILGLILLASLAPATASADWLLSPFAGIRFGATSEPRTLDFERGTEERKFVWGASAAILSDGVLGVEADFSYIPGFFEGRQFSNAFESSRAITLTGNVILATPLAVSSYGLRPYLVGGLGWLRASTNAPTSAGREFSVTNDFLAINVGGGAIGPLTPRTSVRFEVRQFRTINRQEATLNVTTRTKLSFWRAMAGLAIRLD